MSDITPYQRNQIYCGKSEEMLADLPDDCIDLTVTSPPYDNLRTYKGFTLDWHEIIRQLYRVTKPGGVVVWVVADATVNGSETGTSFKQSLWAIECGFRLHDTMVYGKENCIPLNHNRYEPQFEYMFIFSKGAPLTFNPILENSIFAGKTIKRSRKSYDQHSFRPRDIGETKETKIIGNIWMYKLGGYKTENHVAQFPEALARDHIISWSNPGDLVLDPFMGSGTTAKMAMQNGRDYLGFDISEEYCELSRKRVAWANPPLLVVS
jgi:site-specific DNA-methyltransferase (adenine-specific)